MTVTIPAAEKPATDEQVIDVRRRMSVKFTRWVTFVDASVRSISKVTATAFTELSDAPNSLSGAGGKYVRVNTGASALVFDGLVAPTYAVAGLPSATPAGQIIYVSDESGGAVLAFSDATNFRRVTDRKSTRLNSSHIQKSRMPSSA